MSKTYFCLNCNTENKWIYSSNRKNLFCSKDCSQDYRVKEKAKVSPSKGTLHSYMRRFVEYKCSCCGINKWNGKEIILQLDHIDGNNKNNAIENGRWLCANCHTQTETWGIKNVSKEGKERIKLAAKLGNNIRNGKVPLGTRITIV